MIFHWFVSHQSWPVINHSIKKITLRDIYPKPNRDFTELHSGGSARYLCQKSYPTNLDLVIIAWAHIVKRRGPKMSHKPQHSSLCCPFKRREVITPLIDFLYFFLARIGLPIWLLIVIQCKPLLKIFIHHVAHKWEKLSECPHKTQGNSPEARRMCRSIAVGFSSDRRTVPIASSCHWKRSVQRRARGDSTPWCGATVVTRPTLTGRYCSLSSDCT